MFNQHFRPDHKSSLMQDDTLPNSLEVNNEEASRASQGWNPWNPATELPHLNLIPCNTSADPFPPS